MVVRRESWRRAQAGCFHVTSNGTVITKAGWEMPGGFVCQKPEFADYLRASAQYDQQQRMGQLYWAVSGDDVVGYMALTMGSVGMERQADLGIDTYGPVPSLSIAYLATDKRHERQGVGRFMVLYAISLARKMALNVGCRAVVANSERDAVGFYEKLKFARFKPVPPPGHRGFWHWLCMRMDSKGRQRVGNYVPMYFDIGPADQ